MTTTNNTPAISQELNLGLLAYFRGSEVWIDPVDMRILLAGSSVSKKVPDLYPIRAKRAATAAKRFSSTKVRVLAATPIAVGTFEASFSILHKVIDAKSGKAEWLQADRVHWHSSRGWTSEKGLEDSENFIDYATLWQTKLDYSWVRALGVKMIASCESFPMEGGGVFYIPAPQASRFADFQTLIGKIRGAKLIAIKIDGRDEGTRDAIAGAAQDDLKTKIQDTLKKLSDWKEGARGQGATLERMLDGLTELRGRASALSIALNFAADKLDSELDEVDDLIRAELQDMAAQPSISRARGGPAKLAGGAIVEAVIASYAGLGEDTLKVSQMVNYIEEHGLIQSEGKKTPVRVLVSGRIAALVRAQDPRFMKVDRGMYRYSESPTDGSGEPAETEAPQAAPEVPQVIETDEELPPEPGLTIELDEVEPEIETELDEDEAPIDWKVIPADLDERPDWQITGYAKAHGINDVSNLDIVIGRLFDIREGAAL